MASSPGAAASVKAGLYTPRGFSLEYLLITQEGNNVFFFNESSLEQLIWCLY